MALEQEVKVYRFQLAYAEGLLKDIDADGAFKLMCEGGVHPAWSVGHLAMVAGNILKLAGGEPGFDLDQYKALFGGGTKAEPDASKYPAWAQIVSTWKTAREQAAEAALKISDEQLAGPNPNEFLREGLPTLHDFLSFVLTAHEMMHISQLSSWRRIQGHPPLF